MMRSFTAFLFCTFACGALFAHPSVEQHAEFLRAFANHDLDRCGQIASYGVSADSIMQDGEPFLFALLKGGSRRVAQVRNFLQLGADIAIQNKAGATPLEMLLAKERMTQIDLEMLHLLLESGALPAHHGIKSPLLPRLLLSRQLTDLHIAAADLLLSKGIDINEKDSHGQTALQLLLLQGLNDGIFNTTVLQKLIVRGARVSDIEAILKKAFDLRHMRAVHVVLALEIETLAKTLRLAVQYADEFVVEHILFHEGGIVS